MSNFRYLFGPVPSRRFGRSLGVELTPFKTCTLNCAFCEVGRTTQLTLERREYVPYQAVIDELEAWHAQQSPADFITLAGSGEPTLHTRFGEILTYIAERQWSPTALLTNSSLLFLPEVRQAAAAADVVKATLSAWDQASFEALTRPHPALRFEGLLEGLRELRKIHTGALWLEIFIVPGLNDAPAQVQRIAELAASLKADRIHLNTAVRPAAEPGVRALAVEELQRLGAFFRPPGEVIAGSLSGGQPAAALDRERIMAMLRRRPCTALDVSRSFGLEPAVATKLLDELKHAGRIRLEKRAGEFFYRGL